MPTLSLVYFARVREAIGLDGEAVEVPPEVASVTMLVDWLALRGGGYAAAFADRTRLRAAIDDSFAPLDAPLADAHEVALFPPVTGG